MKVTVIGEKCIDEFIYGKCTRLNPEAPTPVFIENYRNENLGMAANVAENLQSLGNTVFRNHQKVEIKKTRYVDEVSNYIMLRVDVEKNIDRINIDSVLIEQISSSDLLVISDYNKGFLYPEDLKSLASFARFSIIDTKKPITDLWAKDFDFIKMNAKEWENPLHENKHLYKEKVIVTQGKNGAIWKENSYKGIEVEVMDVAGAGDSFLAGFSHKWMRSVDIEKSIEYANKIASFVVKKRGVVNNLFIK